jgi:SAM-dependent methyltransferase
VREYYDRRAGEYEEIYRRDDPVRQGELGAIGDALREAVAGRRVLEVACGTGYWTPGIAEVAQRVLGIDTSADVLAIARRKPLPADKVEFRLAEAYALRELPGRFDAAVAIFWLSHVPKARVGEFLEGFHTRLETGAVVFMADNVYIPGVGGELVTRADTDDTYKLRTLGDGSRHQILKNYYDERQLRALLRPWATDLRVQVNQCFWWLSYTTLSSGRVA